MSNVAFEWDMREKRPHLPETADELLVADAAISVDIVVPHKGLQLDFLREDSAKMTRK